MATDTSFVHGGGASVASPYVLSLAERDRRYVTIRAQMTAQGIDVLVLPATTNRWEQSLADSRYVSGIGGFQTEPFTVFPLVGEPTCYLFGRAAFWKANSPWITDVRDGHNAWGDNLIERLHELDFRGGTIGLSQLHGYTRTPDGTFPYGVYERLMKEFPDVNVVDVTEMMVTLRSVKSAEEVEALTKAAAITDHMIDTICSEAKPGNTERDVYAALVHTMLAEGSESPTLLIIGSGPAMPGSTFFPTNRVLEKGDLIIGEFEARVGGYGAQIVAPVSIGEPNAEYREAYRVAQKSFEQFLPEFKSGRTIGDVRDIYRGVVKEVGEGRYAGEFPFMHGRGLGDETPALMSSRDFSDRENQVFDESMTFILKPTIQNTENKMRAQVGRTVHVTSSGAKALDHRTLDLTIAKG